jgi:hypothetical protein
MKNLIAIILLVLEISVISYAGDFVDYPATGKQFNTLVFRFEENLNFENPFDLQTNKVELRIQQPDNSFLTISFFYDGLSEKKVEKWEARFTPKLFGNYKFQVTIDDVIRKQFQIPVEVNKEKKQGGLTLSNNLGVFQYESGESFRGLGMNICWADDYEYYFKKMKNYGMNVTRIWMCPWNLSIEWAHTGLGKYDLKSAEELDKILVLAEKYGIFIILCMDYHGVAQNRAGFFNENKWLENPYNKLNDGPCADGSELFTNETAKTFFKQKYKYIISRYGHSSNIASWEFYNEVDLMAGKAIPVNLWHVEMAEYVQSIDIHNRLVSSSATRNYPEKVVDAFKSPAIDFVMYHHYNVPDMAPYVLDLHRAMNEYYQKPFILGEFGVEYRGGDRTYAIDPQHIGLHNGIWAGFFSLTPVIPLSWWWDNYIDKYDLWFEYNYLADFSSRIDFSNPKIEFKELQSGFLISDNNHQAPCLVNCIYFGDNAALWFKNDNFQWSLVYEGKVPEEIGSFSQIVPGFTEGTYSISWFNPQTGIFQNNKIIYEVGSDGNLNLLVPTFIKDLSCIVSKSGK